MNLFALLSRIGDELVKSQHAFRKFCFRSLVCGVPALKGRSEHFAKRVLWINEWYTGR